MWLSCSRLTRMVCSLLHHCLCLTPPAYETIGMDSPLQSNQTRIKPFSFQLKQSWGFFNRLFLKITSLNNNPRILEWKRLQSENLSLAPNGCRNGSTGHEFPQPAMDWFRSPLVSVKTIFGLPKTISGLPSSYHNLLPNVTNLYLSNWVLAKIPYNTPKDSSPRSPEEQCKVVARADTNPDSPDLTTTLGYMTLRKWDSLALARMKTTLQDCCEQFICIV